MRAPSSLLIPLAFHLAACGVRHEAPQDPGSPTPVSGPAPGRTVAVRPQSPPSVSRPPESNSRQTPARADQAPLVHVLEALETDSLLGRRVRVSGRCVAAGEGRRAGSWTLQDSGGSIEVRGLVPYSCGSQEGERLTIFAQIERTSGADRERLLLRLPD